GQRPADRRDPHATARVRAAARLPQLRRAVARDEDGRLPRRGHRVPARPRAPEQAVRRARSRGADGSCRPTARALGRRGLQRAAARTALRAVRRRAAALFPAAEGARRTVRARRAALRSRDRGAPGRRHVAPGRRLLRDPPARRRRADRRPLHGPVRTAAEARRRVDGLVLRPRTAARARARSGRVSRLQLQPARRGHAVAADARRGRHAVPRARPHAPHLLTEVGYPSLAGINGVAWDAVELPSQFLENYAWRPEVLKSISGHHETGEPLPDEKIERLNGSRTFMEGLATVRQLEFALFDFLLHVADEPPDLARTYALLDDVRREVAVIRPPEYNRFPSTFSHIFGAGFAVWYYSYNSVEDLAADALASSAP